MPLNFNREPYFDDYDEDDKFHRILFRPGFAVQTRELNQLQTILQEQVSRFGDHVFKNGSLVIPGAVDVNGEISHVRVQEGDLLSPLDNVYEGAKIENSAGVTGEITTISRVENGDPVTLYFTYTTGGQFNQNETLTITYTDETTTEDVTTEDDPDYTGESTLVSVGDGVYFINEEFVNVTAQTVIASKYNPIRNITSDDVSIGFFTGETIVTPEQDSTLLDNAQGTFNETAPGAHRLKIDPQLVLRDNVTNLSDYIEIARISNGEIAKEVRESDFDVLGDSLAQRSFETNGSFVVDNFNISIDDHPTDETKLRVGLEEGKAFIRGFRVDTLDTRRIDIDKSRTTDNAEDALVPLQLGDFIHVKTVFSYPELFGTVGLYSDASLSFTNNAPDEPSTLIGTASVRAAVYDSVQSALEGETVLRLHLFNFDIDSGSSLSDVKTLYSDDISPAFAAEVSAASIESGETTIQNSSDEVAIYNLPYPNVDSVLDSSFNFFKSFSTAVSSGSQITVSTPITSEQLRDETTDYIVSVTSVNSGSTTADKIGLVDTPDSVTVSSDNKTATLDVTSLGINETDDVIVHAVVFKSPGAIKSKNPVLNETLSVTTPSSEISLGLADVYELVSIVDGSGNDYTRRYELDTGQRDTHYDIARLLLRPGAAAPTNSVTVTFNYFSHGGGDFFVADSYSSIAYGEIPTYESDAGEEYPLASSIDFRPIINTSGEFFNTPVSYVPDSEAILNFDYYLAQRVKIALTADGDFVTSRGNPEIDPPEPRDPDNAISLYDITLNAYTFDSEDTDTVSIPNPRYRMRDIGLLEERIQDLEYYTSLNLLERDAISKEFVDKFKTGILVDPLFGHDIGDATKDTYAVSMDTELGEMRPECSSKSISLIEDGTSTNIQTTGNVITLPYTEVTLVDQSVATVLQRVQPFIKYSWNGDLELNPSSDSWVSTQRVPDTTLDGGNKYTDAFKNNNNPLGTIWGGWKTIWRPIKPGHGGYDTIYRTGIRTVQTERTEIERLGDRVVDRAAVPYIRSRNIDFSAVGMKPLTTVIPFFDEVDVSDFVTPAGGSQGDPIITDGAGSVSGTFEIPNNDDLRFRTGIRSFELRDKIELPSTTALDNYTAQGILESLSTFFLTTTVVDIVRRRVSREVGRTYYDPLAQSFEMPLRGGGFITSIDIYFGPEASGSLNPVTLELRNMVNGLPGNEIVSSVVLTPDQLNGSSDASTATRFSFDSPVYLEEAQEYCFVLLTISQELTVWKSVVGQGDIQTGEQLTRQPFLGSLFKSQNNRTWTPAQLEDLKFQINRAEFDTSVTGQASFTNEVSLNDQGTEADPHTALLELDPFEFTDTSTYILVSHPNHSMTVGDTVRFSAENSTSLAGVPESEIFDTDLTVSVGPSNEEIGIDFYYVQVTTAATESNQLGGGAVFATQHVGFSVFYPIVESLDLGGTNTNWVFKGTSKFGKVEDAGFRNLIIDHDNILTFPRTVTESGDESISVQATLESSNSNVSPYIDTKRFSFIATENRVNNLEDDNNEPESDNALARYLTKPVELVNPANEISVFFDANRPPSASIDVYYKVKPIGSGVRFSDQDWVKFEGDVIPTANENYNSFSEYSFNHTFNEDFNIYAIKIVMRSTNEARVPRIRDLRVIAIKG